MTEIPSREVHVQLPATAGNQQGEKKAEELVTLGFPGNNWST